MKRALAILAVASMFGFAGFAQFSGSWDLSVDLLPAVDMSSTLTLEYSFAGWVFSSVSDFDATDGFSSQKFSVTGTLGAVSLESEAAFLPSAVDYTWYQVNVQTAPTTCPFYDTTVTEKYPTLDYWKTTLSLSFAGVEAEALMYLKAYPGGWEAYDLVDYHTMNPTGWSVWFWCGDNIGTGWRVKVAGQIDSITISSYTYFNLDETVNLFTDEGCPQIEFKGDYAIHWDEWCGVGFNRELITLEGLSICCGTTLNAALSISCIGFDYLFVYVEDVPVFPWINISPWVKFTTASKEFGFCATPVTAAGCITVGVELEREEEFTHNDILNSIDEIIIKEISLTCEFTECMSFSASTLLYELRDNAYYVLNDPNKQTWLVDVADYYVGDEYIGTLYKCVTFPEAKYFAWEKVGLSFCGPGCCGGEYEIDVTAYFGKGYEITGYEFEWAPEPEETLPGEKEAKEHECISFKPVYGDEIELNTLFGWMMTSASASVPLTADISLNVDLSVSFLGIEDLGVGLSFQF